MADILSQEEIDALLEVVDDDGAEAEITRKTNWLLSNNTKLLFMISSVQTALARNN